jgi:hypothetical protein
MEPVRIIGKVNEVNKEFVDNYAKINQLYKQHFEDMQRMNQQWLEHSIIYTVSLKNL